MELVEELALKGGGIGLFTGCAAGDTGASLFVQVDLTVIGAHGQQFGVPGHGQALHGGVSEGEIPQRRRAAGIEEVDLAILPVISVNLTNAAIVIAMSTCLSRLAG